MCMYVYVVSDGRYGKRGCTVAVFIDISSHRTSNTPKYNTYLFKLRTFLALSLCSSLVGPLSSPAVLAAVAVVVVEVAPQKSSMFSIPVSESMATDPRGGATVVRLPRECVVVVVVVVVVALALALACLEADLFVFVPPDAAAAAAAAEEAIRSVMELVVPPLLLPPVLPLGVLPSPARRGLVLRPLLPPPPPLPVPPVPGLPGSSSPSTSTRASALASAAARASAWASRCRAMATAVAGDDDDGRPLLPRDERRLGIPLPAAVGVDIGGGGGVS